MLSRLYRFNAVLVLLVTAAHAQATVLDWDAVTWAAGSLSNSYDIDASSAGNDVTITVAGDTGQLQPKFGLQAPAIANGIEGGLSPAQNNLFLQLDLANQSQSVTLTVDFSTLYTAGVTNVSFTIFDVDFSNVPGSSTFQDQLRGITATSITDTQVAPTITISSTHALTGSGLNQVVTGNATNPDSGPGSGSGNVTISFDANLIKSFTFTYGSGTGTVADPTGQSIGFHDFTFTVVPEISPARGSLLACAVAIGLTLLQRARKSPRAGASLDK
jgi:hypothetical protein